MMNIPDFYINSKLIEKKNTFYGTQPDKTNRKTKQKREWRKTHLRVEQ